MTNDDGSKHVGLNLTVSTQTCILTLDDTIPN